MDEYTTCKNIKLLNKTMKIVKVYIIPDSRAEDVFISASEIGEIEPEKFLQPELPSGEEIIRFCIKTDCLFKIQNIEDDLMGRIFIQTLPLNINETKEIHIHDCYFYCDGKIMPFPAESNMHIRNCGIVKYNHEWNFDMNIQDIDVESSLKNLTDFSKYEVNNKNIGLINKSGKNLYTKIENRNCRRQLFFNLDIGKLSFACRESEEAYVSFSDNIPFDEKSKTYLVSNYANYLIDAKFSLHAIGEGKATLSPKTFDQVTKIDEDPNLMTNLGIIEVVGPENPPEVEEGFSIRARVERKKFGTHNHEFLYNVVEGNINNPTKFLRESNTFFKMEILAHEFTPNKGLVYKVQTGKRYQFTHQKQLKDLETDLFIQPTKESFFSNKVNDDALLVDYYKPDICNKDLIYFQEQVPLLDKKDDKQFTDEYFPPEERIIAGKDEKGNYILSRFSWFNNYDENGEYCSFYKERDLLNEYQNLRFNFKLPNEIYEGECFLFNNCDDIGKINQGLIENFWTQIVFTALAARPNLVKNIFKTKQLNPRGFYELYYYDVYGRKKLMFLDDYFPIVEGKTLFSISLKNEIWPLLLEKSFAKYEGGYTNLKLGNYEEALWFWTGKKCITYNNSDFEEKWDLLCEAINSKFILCAVSFEFTTDEDASLGIGLGEAYSIMDAKHYIFENGKELRLIMLRNPWNKKKWKGDYSDDSTLWCESTKKYFNYESIKKDFKSFWIKFEDFIRLFSHYFICECSDF